MKPDYSNYPILIVDPDADPPPGHEHCTPLLCRQCLTIVGGVRPIARRALRRLLRTKPIPFYCPVCDRELWKPIVGLRG